MASFKLLWCFNPHFCSLKRRRSLLFSFIIAQQTDAHKSRTYGEIVTIPVLFAPLLRKTKKQFTTQHNYIQASPCGSFSGHSGPPTGFSLLVLQFAQYHSTNVPYSFSHLSPMPYNFSNWRHQITHLKRGQHLRPLMRSVLFFPGLLDIGVNRLLQLSKLYVCWNIELIA